MCVFYPHFKSSLPPKPDVQLLVLDLHTVPTLRFVAATSVVFALLTASHLKYQPSVHIQGPDTAFMFQIEKPGYHSHAGSILLGLHFHLVLGSSILVSDLHPYKSPRNLPPPRQGCTICIFSVTHGLRPSTPSRL